MTMMVNVLRVVTFFGCTIFAMSYAIFAPTWHKDQVGRTIMTFTGSAAGLLGLGMLQLILGPTYWGQDTLRALLFVGLGGGIWWQWWLLLKVQLANRNHDKEMPDVE